MGTRIEQIHGIRCLVLAFLVTLAIQADAQMCPGQALYNCGSVQASFCKSKI